MPYEAFRHFLHADIFFITPLHTYPPSASTLPSRQHAPPLVPYWCHPTSIDLRLFSLPLSGWLLLRYATPELFDIVFAFAYFHYISFVIFSYAFAYVAAITLLFLIFFFFFLRHWFSLMPPLICLLLTSLILPFSPRLRHFILLRYYAADAFFRHWDIDIAYLSLRFSDAMPLRCFDATLLTLACRFYCWYFRYYVDAFGFLPLRYCALLPFYLPPLLIFAAFAALMTLLRHWYCYFICHYHYSFLSISRFHAAFDIYCW